MKRKWHIEVTQGGIHVNSAWVAYESPRCLIIEADLRAKYAEVQATSDREVFIGRGERTLAHDGDAHTTLAVSGLGRKDWIVLLAEVSRYTLRIVLLARESRRHLKPVWTDGDRS